MSQSSTTDADAAPSVGVVVVAAGSGTRLGADVPKAFVRLAGRTLLSYAVATVAQVRGLTSLAIVLPDGWLPDGPHYDHEISRHAPDRTSYVPGGAERSDSVRIGLSHLDPACEVILVHDAARCLTPVTVFERCIAAVAAGDAGAVPGLPVVDTIKTVDADGVITGTPDRALLRAVQTPQAFRAGVLRAAYDSGLAATDDAALVEACGHPVRVVEGDPLAFKVTTPDDLARAERAVCEEAR